MSLFGNTGASASNANPTQGDLKNDIAVTSPPEDSVSDIRFSPVADFLAVSSWDKKVRIYEVDQNGNTQGKALFDHEGPVLGCCWSQVCTQFTIDERKDSSLMFEHRMVKRCSVQEQTKQPACWI